MIYLLDGKETYLLAKKKSELLSREELIPENIMTVDASSRTDFSMREVLAMCSTVSLFSEARAVVVDNPFFLKTGGRKTTGKPAKRKKNEPDQSDAGLLESYCRMPSDSTDLIIYCFGYDADKRTKEYQVLDQYRNHSVTHIHCGEMSPFELERAINDTLRRKKYRIDPEGLAEFKARIAGSTTAFYRAMDKLDLYGEKNLNAEDIRHLVPAEAEVDIWKLGNSFLAGNSAETFRTYRDLVELQGMAVQGLIPLLASQIRGVYNSVVCHEAGMSFDMIRQYAGRMYPDKDLRSAGRNNSGRLLKMLKELADLDQKVKTGRIDERDGFESFLMRYL